MIGVGTAGPIAAPPASGSTAVHLATGPMSSVVAVERDAWAILTSVEGLGPVAMVALLARYQTARAVLQAAGATGAVADLAATPALESETPRARRRPIPSELAIAIVAAAEGSEKFVRHLRDLDLRVVTLEDVAFPGRLRQVAMPPHLLFVRGAVEALSPARSVAVVGTRRASSYGRRTTERLVEALVAAEATVISGLAYGIDGAAHDATIRRGGRTVAVIGGGHATGIPSAHQRLADAIVGAGGAVVSEYAPDTLPTRGTFPRRNRVISGMADATLVVEAPARSGALITASWALEQGRPCFLVPGPIDAPNSAGCLGLLREFPEATRIVAGVPQLIADLGYATATPEAGADPVAHAAVAALGDTARRIAAALVDGTTTVDELVAVTDLPIAAVLAALGLLEGRGLVTAMYGRYRPVGDLLGAPIRPVVR